MWRRGPAVRAPSEEPSIDNDEDREFELPGELVGQYVDLGRRRAAVWEALLEMLSQHAGLGSASDLDDDTRETLEEDLEEMIAEAFED